MKTIVTSAIFSLIFFFMASNVFAGLGISPAQMFFDNLSPGAHIEKIFILSRSDYQEDSYFKANVEGVTKDWITIDRGIEFRVPSGEQRFSIVVTADIPKGVLAGEYSGSIRLVPWLPNSGNTSVANDLSALIPVNFTIGDKVITEAKVSTTPAIQGSEKKQNSWTMPLIISLLVIVSIAMLAFRLKKIIKI